MFWKTCVSLVNGACPIQARAFAAHMAPRCGAAFRHEDGHAVTADPGHARLPSGTLVDVLCGQPEQKYAPRVSRGGSLAARASSSRSRATRCSSAGMATPGATAARRSTRAIRIGESSPSLGSRALPSSSCLPIRRGCSRQVEQRLGELVLDEAALFFHHQQLGQAAGETARALHFQRPDQADLVQPDAERRGFVIAQGRVHRTPRARRDRTCPPQRCPDAAARGSITTRSSALARANARDRRHARPVQPLLLFQRRVGPADVQPAFRHREIARQHNSGRAISTATEADVSTVCPTALKPTQQPEKRDNAKPNRPKSR